METYQLSRRTRPDTISDHSQEAEKVCCGEQAGARQGYPLWGSNPRLTRHNFIALTLELRERRGLVVHVVFSGSLARAFFERRSKPSISVVQQRRIHQPGSQAAKQMKRELWTGGSRGLV